jgi:hypothetical protein
MSESSTDAIVSDRGKTSVYFAPSQGSYIYAIQLCFAENNSTPNQTKQDVYTEHYVRELYQYGETMCCQSMATKYILKTIRNKIYTVAHKLSRLEYASTSCT